MATRKDRVHRCVCEQCQQHPHSALAQHHRSINRLLAQLDEKSRRRVVGLLASRQPHGGLEALHQITGLSGTTIRRGREEVEHLDPSPGIRAAGGGRHAVEKNIPRS